MFVSIGGLGNGKLGRKGHTLGSWSACWPRAQGERGAVRGASVVVQTIVEDEMEERRLRPFQQRDLLAG